MSFDAYAVRQYLQNFDFRNLFTQELGWDRHAQNLPVDVEGQTYALEGVAKKRDIAAFVCGPDREGRIPKYAVRRKIEAQVTKSAYEHLIIYTDGQKEQVWQWMRREKGKPTVPREATFYADTTGDLLIQKLRVIAVELDEEDALTLTGQLERHRKAFDVEAVTTRFYRGFKDEHAGFVAAIHAPGLTKGEREWYASVMLNRLMFLYFIQRKGFLDGKTDYLQTKLAEVQAKHGREQFFTFYRGFLLRLFHEGLGQPAPRAADLEALLGKVPYLNGGLFAEHAVERACRERNIQIHIPDATFESVFAFFARFDWHLDNRKNKAGNEINPDVLGYIFEKYINFNEAGQKENGAYYTKEDITEYISRSTILPYLLDTAQAAHPGAFKNGESVWSLLRKDPDRYIYEAVAHGANLPLPANIAVGIGDVSRRGDWNRPAPCGDDEIGLPTEIWRETVARRQRYEELKAKLERGEIATVNDLITCNLNLPRFVRDAIMDTDDPRLLRALWQAIKNVRVLDPTVGSGAFLFAALNILEPLYERCLERMEGYVGDVTREQGMTWLGEMPFVNEVSAQQAFVDEGDETPTDYARDFQAELAHVNAPQHPNRAYFIYKSIIVNNLFGVDIMEEATEICKLRLFLKLVAQVDPDTSKPNMGVEPLPDVDFNVIPGNTLVGYVNENDIDRSWQAAEFGSTDRTGSMSFERDKEKLRQMVQSYATMLHDFRDQQLGIPVPMVVTKANVERAAGEELRPELDKDLWRLYRKVGKFKEKTKQETFRTSHMPIHWFVEFPEVMAAGGFDVIIGNPPYVEYSKVRGDYTIHGYQTESCGNLYAFVMERAKYFLKEVFGRCGLIIQLSAFSTPRMQPVNLLATQSGYNFISFFECRPGKLFEGVDVRLAIWLYKNDPANTVAKTSGLYRFPSEFREYLFPTLSYANATNMIANHVTPKLTDDTAVSIYGKLTQKELTLGDARREDGQQQAYYSYGIRYWARVLNTKPFYKSDVTDVSTGEKIVAFDDAMLRDAVVCVMTSSLFFWFYCVVSDGHNFTKTVIDSFPVGSFSKPTLLQLQTLCSRLMKQFEADSYIRTATYKTTGNIQYREYRVSGAKHIIDEIDRVLAAHYGFTDAELDFVLNYDIKYRMGRGGGEEAG